LEVPFFRQEVTGVPMLLDMAETLFGPATTQGGEGDPTRHFYVGKPQDIFRQDGYYVLSIPLPLVERAQVQLHRSVFDELVIHIGNWKRNISLPLGLARLAIDGAEYVEDRLNIRFAPEPGGELPPETLTTTAWDSLRARLGGKAN
jgi:arsenite-transporting ATPase